MYLRLHVMYKNKKIIPFSFFSYKMLGSVANFAKNSRLL